MNNPTRRDDELIRRGDVIAALHEAANGRYYAQEAIDEATVNVDAIPAANPAQGGEWVMVPREPTEAMRQAARASGAGSGWLAAYQSMLATSPAAPAAVAQETWQEEALLDRLARAMSTYGEGDGGEIDGEILAAEVVFYLNGMRRASRGIATPPPSPAVASDGVIARGYYHPSREPDDPTNFDWHDTLDPHCKSCIAAVIVRADAIAAPAVAREVDDARKRRVFVDMDGVIVDFDAYKTTHGLTGDEVKRKPGAYLDMPAIPGAIEAVRSLIGMGYDVWIATKPPTGVAFAYADKVQWVLNHLPELKRRIVVTHDKGMLGGPRDILCDDRPHKANCEDFAGTLLRFVGDYHWPQALRELSALTADRGRV